MATLSAILETTDFEKVAGGLLFTEGPLWHPEGFFYFVDIRGNVLCRVTPGLPHEVVRTTEGGNGTTFDLQGRLINCEGAGRRVTRTELDGTVVTLVDHFEGKRLNRPNDVICRSDGTLFFTDPGLRVPLAERELDNACIYRINPDDTVAEVGPFEYPNGLALSPDERTLYVANTRWTQYIHAVELNEAGEMSNRRIFADMSAEGTNGVPDGMKVDVEGRVFCTGTDGTWVFSPDGALIGIIETPELCANIAFGGPDMQTLLFTASTSVYTLRVKTPGLPHPWYG
ncbi:MAG: SMP-30/gluconolactonase/LRE family protein [Geodermatophilaceae bacterium]|jgi:gluconolactonase|nr:SMP-30/gluconolactonase/LRE family protein [Geodermatophilaceae bacterium]